MSACRNIQTDTFTREVANFSSSLSLNETSSPTHRLAKYMLYTSEKVESGSPSIYKLHMMNAKMRRAESMIARRIIAKPYRFGSGEVEKVLLVVGAVGAGKTTFINGMVNYILGVEWKDDFRFKLITEEDKEQQASNKTQGITAYTFYPMKGSAVPYTFTIIDTPGFGATEGYQGLTRDEEITAQMREFFSIPPPDGIDHVDGIGFVVQASQACVTQTQKYIITSCIKSIFGNDVSKNLFMMITFADGQRPPVLDSIHKANISNHSKKHFKFNNSALFAENKESEYEMCFNEMFWKMGFTSFKNFFAEFENTESVSLSLSKDELKEREQLYVLTEGLHLHITLGLNKLEEIQQEENVLQGHRNEILTNKNFKYTVDVTKEVTEDLEGTTCITRNPDDEEDQVGMSSKCKICQQNVTWSEHKHRPSDIKYKTGTETRTAEEMKRKYLGAVEEETSSERLSKSIEESFKEANFHVLNMIMKAQQSFRRLDEIALKPNPLTQVEYLELLIESEKRELTAGWEQRIQHLEIMKSAAEMLAKGKDERETQKLIESEKRKASPGWKQRI